MSKLVLITTLPQEHVQRLRERFPELEVVDCAADRARVDAEIVDADYAYGRVFPEQFARAKRLKFIQVATHGVDTLLFPELVASDVLIASGKGLWSRPVAEHTMALLLAMCRAFPEIWRAHQAQHWFGDGTRMRVLRNLTMGFLGAGCLAQEIARLSEPFGPSRLAYCRRGGKRDGFERVYSGEELTKFLSDSDVVINTLPLTEETQKLMGQAEFAAMKPGAFFINVGRGATVDEAALLEALRSGHLGGAGLDVFEREPLPADSPFWGLDNVIITAHTAGHGEFGTSAPLELLCENLRRIRAGQLPFNLVDKTAGY